MNIDRLSLARHFQTLTSISRRDIFGAAEQKYRPLHLAEDSATMFPGYVGGLFTSDRGLLVLAINPGGGGDAYTCRTAEDNVFYPLVVAFRDAKSPQILAAFERLNQSFGRIVERWNLWRIFGPTLNAAGRSMDEVAYVNIVPYRTRQDAMPPAAARRVAWERIVAPTIPVLAPCAIVTLGKKAGSVVDRLHRGSIPTYCVPRIIGDAYVSADAALIHDQMRASLSDD